MKVLVTGSNGFIGKNLIMQLRVLKNIQILTYDTENTVEELDELLEETDFVFHLAGVNRPKNQEDFLTGNVGLTDYICNQMAKRADPPPILLSSSIQAELDNPYGRSKRLAEETVIRYGEQTGALSIIYRLKNVFGKWSRPNYNTVVATFCYNIAHNLPITISNPAHQLELVHIDDVVRHFISELNTKNSGSVDWKDVTPVFNITLGQLAALIRSFRDLRETLQIPDLGDPFIHKLYGMYLTYLDENNFAYNLTRRCDERGCLAEFVKSKPFGQIFVSRTKPGITRGNHYHHTKAEKFLVLQGKAVIRFRHLYSNEVVEYITQGSEFKVVDIPPGYTHSIENIGEGELVTLFWASEIFDPEQMDTVWEEVNL